MAGIPRQFTPDIEAQICDDYEHGTPFSVLIEIYATGHRNLRRILIDNGVKIRKWTRAKQIEGTQ